MLILFFKYLITNYKYIDLIYTRLILTRILKLFFNYCLLYFENLSFDFKFASKKHTFNLILINAKLILICS